jgi:zinc protease
VRAGHRRSLSRLVRFAACATLSLTLIAIALPARAMDIQQITSPGGIVAWLVHEEAVPLVAINFAFHGGTTQDPAGKAGTANLVSALLDEGAGPYDSKAFHQKLTENAVEFRYSAGRDYFRGTMRVLSSHRDEGFELLRLMLNEPHFDSEPVERIRAQLIAGLIRARQRPAEVAALDWWAAAFPDHPYGRPVRGSPETVAKVTIDDLKTYRQHVFARAGLKVAIVGDVDAATAGKLIDKVFGGLPAKGELVPIPNAKPQGMGQRIVHEMAAPQPVTVFGGASVAREDPDFYAAFIDNYILGGGSFSSRLYAEVREKRGLAYTVHESLVWLDHAQLVVGSTGTRPDRAAEALGIIEREVKRMREEGPTADELAKAKSYLKGSYALNLDTSGKIAAQLVQIQIDKLGIDYIKRRNALIDAVTLDDAKRVAKRLYADGLLVTIAGRPSGFAAKTPPRG